MSVPDSMRAKAELDIVKDFRSQHPSVAIDVTSEKKVIVFGYKNDVVELSSLLRKQLTECSTVSLRESIRIGGSQATRTSERSAGPQTASTVHQSSAGRISRGMDQILGQYVFPCELQQRLRLGNLTQMKVDATVNSAYELLEHKAERGMVYAVSDAGDQPYRMKVMS